MVMENARKSRITDSWPRLLQTPPRKAGCMPASNTICPHEDVHLCDGLAIGHLIECPKQSGQFDCRTGDVRRTPACLALPTYPVRMEGARVFLGLD